MGAAIRLVGLLSLALATGIAYFRISEIRLGHDIVSQQLAGGQWSAPISAETVLTRTHLQGGAGIVAALLTAAAGAGFLTRRRWGLWLALVATAVPPLFPPATRLLLPEELQLGGPDLEEWLVASLVGLMAAAGFMFRVGFKSDS